MLEKATYSYSKVQASLREVKNFSLHVSRKAEHFSKACELKDLYDHAYDNTTCLLFDWHYTPMEDYYKASYYYGHTRGMTKKQLDDLERAAYSYLKRELLSIYADMQAGDVNTID